MSPSPTIPRAKGPRKGTSEMHLGRVAFSAKGPCVRQGPAVLPSAYLFVLLVLLITLAREELHFLFLVFLSFFLCCCCVDKLRMLEEINYYKHKTQKLAKPNKRAV